MRHFLLRNLFWSFYVTWSPTSPSIAVRIVNVWLIQTVHIVAAYEVFKSTNYIKLLQHITLNKFLYISRATRYLYLYLSHVYDDYIKIFFIHLFCVPKYYFRRCGNFPLKNIFFSISANFYVFYIWVSVLPF